jgi:glyoxylase-like metal-dependent hydrolase (beta-lactamase superfamily II)
MRGQILRLLMFVTVAFVAASPATAAPAAPVSPRLYVFDCGKLDIPDTTPYQLKRNELATNMMSVPCFLVAHPKGTLMWDVGAVPDRMIPAGGTGSLREHGFSDKKLETQLAEIGYAASDITYLAISHFHWDHVGNANLFAGSTWLVRPLEREVMFSNPPSQRTEPDNYTALKDSKTVLIKTKDYDVFGDGSVIIKSAPGHSPDHQVLFVKLANTGPVLLSGDLYHYPEERKLKRVPTTEFNRDQTALSRAEIEAFLKQTGAQLWIEHDFTGNAKLKKAPEWYD